MRATQNFPTVGELAKEHPLAIQALQRHGIDWCCNQQPLDQACAECGVEVEELLEEIRRAEEEPSQAPVDWEQQPVEELIEHILKYHHRPMDLELPRLEALARKVLQTHGVQAPEQLTAVYSTFKALREELERHMTMEEQTLFPWICGTEKRMSDEPVRVMLLEHQSMGWLMQRLRTLTDNFRLPAEGCEAWRALWEGLEKLEADLEEHGRLEHEILFPRLLRRN